MQSAKSEERFLNFLSTKATVGLGRSLNRKRFSKRRAKSRPHATSSTELYTSSYAGVRLDVDARMSAPEKMPLSLLELLKYGSFGFEAVNTTWNTYTYLSYLV